MLSAFGKEVKGRRIFRVPGLNVLQGPRKQSSEERDIEAK